MTQILLYTTAGCHLCELAKRVLWPLISEYQLQLRTIDIADSDQLIESYGVRIPVIGFASSAKELNWPFDEAQARDFIESVGV